MTQLVWNILTSSIATLSVAVAIVIYFLQKKTKRLLVDIEFSTPIVTVQSGFEERVQTFYAGREIKAANFFVITLENTGNVPILESEYSAPLSFKFSEQQILFAGILQTGPNYIKADYTLAEGGKVFQLQPTLLNPGDFISLRFLVEGPSKKVTEICRIAGLSTIDHERNPFGSSKLFYLAGILASFFLLLSILERLGLPNWTHIVPLLVGISVGYFVEGRNRKKEVDRRSRLRAAASF